MKTSELFEGVKFSVEHQHGRNKRAHDMSLSKVNDSIMFTPAEKKQIAKLNIGSTLTTQSKTISGRTLIRVTRVS